MSKKYLKTGGKLIMKWNDIRNKIRTFAIIGLLPLFLCLNACNGLFDKDNAPTPTPLHSFNSTLQPQLAWSTQVGAGSKEDLKSSPIVYNNALITSNANGIVTSIDRKTGRTQWKRDTGAKLITGPAAGNNLIVVASRDAKIIALNEQDGSIRWKTEILGEILANPAIGGGVVIVKTIDGHVQAFNALDGKKRWSYQQTEPNFILHGASAPIIENQNVIIGFANGNLVKLQTQDGRFDWSQSIATPQGAFALERMVDITANPLIFNHRLYAATYQGQITAIDWYSGKKYWSYNLSSNTGMTADTTKLYISDAKSHVYAFDIQTGAVKWQQTALEARGITAPVVISNYLVVADKEGYLHWLDQKDGRFVARVKAPAGFNSAPLVDQQHLYAITNNGNLLAYRLG